MGIVLSLIEVAYCSFHEGGWINYITEVTGRRLMDGGVGLGAACSRFTVPSSHT
jgi:hypothetical protein